MSTNCDTIGEESAHIIFLYLENEGCLVYIARLVVEIICRGAVQYLCIFIENLYIVLVNI